MAQSARQSVKSHIPGAESGSYPVRPGNVIVPLVDGDPAFRRICEAVEAAEHSVWVTIAFLGHDFEMPDGQGSLFDVLDRAKSRGLDVRAIFWRPTSGDWTSDDVFPGNDDQRAMLQERGSKFLARWDRAQKAYCQHQKSWLVDAGRDNEIAFVGGINLGRGSVVSPGHIGGSEVHVHDVYVEMQGPAATDVHHNFVQRWNEASDRTQDTGVWPSPITQTDLDFPTSLTDPKGSDAVQVQRTIKAGHYTDMTATPGGLSFAVNDGEFSIFEQYLKAINAAITSIYIEDQAIGSADIVEALHKALERDVCVTVLVPADAHHEMAQARKSPQARPFFDRLGQLGTHDHFLLAGIANYGDDGVLRNIYVHAKIMLVDDHWATIGSCNIGNRSFFNDTELNASFWSDAVVRNLRCDLLQEHLGIDTAQMNDREAMQVYRDTARTNRARRLSGERMGALAFALDPTAYPEQFADITTTRSQARG